MECRHGQKPRGGSKQLLKKLALNYSFVHVGAVIVDETLGAKVENQNLGAPKNYLGTAEDL